MKKVLFILLLMCAFMLLPEFMVSAIAQPPPPDIDPQVPIDSGLAALLLAGMAYGAKKLRTENKSN